MKRIKEHRYMYRRGEALIFRRSVPPYAQAIFGKGEVQVSLKTNDIAEARHRWIRELSKFETLLSLASGTRAPSETIQPVCIEPTSNEVDAGVRAWLATRMARVSTSLSEGTTAGKEIKRKSRDLRAYSKATQISVALGNAGPTITTRWIADEIVHQNGWLISENSELYVRLVKNIARGEMEASHQQRQVIKGEPRTVVDGMFLPDQYLADEDRQRERPSDVHVSLLILFDGYTAERKPALSTIRAWKRQLNVFIEYLGHDNARMVSHSDVQNWKEHLLSTPNRQGRLLSARTVKDTYLAAIKAVFGWAVENGRLSENATNMVRVRPPKRQRLREAGLRDDEALTILRGTLLAAPAKLSTERAFALRWVPWLCAYTGARVNEITQLRKEDVTEIRSIWTILITPEAGTVKNKQASVPRQHLWPRFEVVI